MQRRLLHTALLAAVLAAQSPATFAQAAQKAPDNTAVATGWATLASGSVVLLRHAEAPGVGDPAGFQLNDCRTQRNLNDAGRAQARHIGAAFRQHGVAVAQVLSSQWCRTRETAELAFPGQAKADPRFNSFFDAPDHAAAQGEAAQTAAALALLVPWRGPGVLVVVTHQVNITALTGVVPASGEMVVVRPQGDALAVVARLRP